MLSDRIRSCRSSPKLSLPRLSVIHTSAAPVLHTKRKAKFLLSPFLVALLSMILIFSLRQIPQAEAYSTEQFQFYLRDEFMDLIPEGINVTAYQKIGGYITFHVPQDGLLWNASWDVLYFSFDLGGGAFRQYWLLDGETSGTIWIYAGNHTYGISGLPYTLNFIDLAGVLADYPFVEVIKTANAVGGGSGIVERRKLDLELKINAWAIYGDTYNIKILSNITSYTFGDLLFSNVLSIPLTLKGLDFPQNIILAYKYNRIWAERYNNFSTIKTIYEDTQGDLANVTVTIYYQNETVAASTSYSNTASFIYTWLLAQYNKSYTVRVVITHSVYGVMNYNAILFHGGSFNPWSFPLGSIPNLNTADIIPMCIIGGCFFLFSKANAFIGAFFSIAVAIILCVLGWASITAIFIMAAIVFTIMLGLAYSKRRVFYS